MTQEDNRFKNKCMEECKDYSKTRIIRNMIFLRIVMIFLNPVGLWVVDISIWAIIPFGLFLIDLNVLISLFFLICHILYWEFIGKKRADEFINDILSIHGDNTLDIMYDALKEVKNKKYK